MSTFHQHALALVKATQLGLTTVPMSRVFVEREAPIEKDECPAINIEPGEIQAESIGSDGQWDLLRVRYAFRLLVHTRGDPQTALADPVIAEANASLMNDPSLGGYAMRLGFKGSKPQRQAADGTAGIWALSYEAQFVANERTLELQPAT